MAGWREGDGEGMERGWREGGREGDGEGMERRLSRGVYD
jgi:hypothetical protein